MFRQSERRRARHCRGSAVCPARDLDRALHDRYRSHAQATVGNGKCECPRRPVARNQGVCGRRATFGFAMRAGTPGLAAKYEMWVNSLENAALSERLFQAAVDLADAAKGLVRGCCAIRRPRCRFSSLRDQLDAVRHTGGTVRHAGSFCTDSRRNVHELDPAVLGGLAGPTARLSWTVRTASRRRRLLLHTEPRRPTRIWPSKSRARQRQWRLDGTEPC